MDKTAPSPGRIAAMVVFSLSCFGLLLFLWLSFGGATPLKPRGYRVAVPMEEAFGLNVTSDVRISGVSVGKVSGVRREGDRTRVEIEIEERYAPVPRATRATLRRKTLLGEAYVELTPEDRRGPQLPEGATLPEANVQPSVDLDEVLSTFDRPTRRRIQAWLQRWARGMDGRSRDVSGILGHLPGAAEGGADLLSVLRGQRGAMETLVRDAGRTFAVIGRRQSRVQQLVTSGERLFDATAAREQELGETVEALPPFLGSLRRALRSGERLSEPLLPVLRELRPGARRLEPTLSAATAVAPDVERLAAELDRFTEVAPSGLRATRSVINAASPLLGQLYPLGRQLVPIAEFLDLYRLDLANSWPKVSAVLQAKSRDPETGRQIHYLRATAVVMNETFGVARHRQPYSRPSTYAAPGGVRELENGVLKAFDCSHTRNPVEVPPLGPAPPCLVQDPITFRGRTAAFPRLEPAP